METLLGRIIELEKIEGEKIAVAFKNDSISYAQLLEKICKTASIFEKNGIKKGDRVCFSAISKPESVVIYLGIQLVGAIAVFLDKNSTPQNMISIYKSCDAKLLLTDKPLKDLSAEANLLSIIGLFSMIEDENNEIVSRYVSDYCIPDGNDIAELIYTTGTTGKPKGVKLSYKAINSIWNNTISGIGIKSDDVVLLPLPLNHSFALRVLRATLYQGATVVLQNGFTFARAMEENIDTFGCSALACVPASYEVMKSQMQEEFERVISKLRYVEFGAGSLSVRQRLEITDRIPNVQIYNTWGSSESGGAIFCDVTACAKAFRCGDNTKLIESLGKPLDGEVEVGVLALDAPIGDISVTSGNIENYIINSDANNPGRMILKGDMQMSGYWNDNDNTSLALVNNWLLTGDMVYLDDDKNIYMLGRADDIINVGGEKVSPIEVENIAGQYDCIRECACIGVDDPDGITGQIPVLFVVVSMDYSEDDFIKYLSSKMERFKLPQRLMRVAELPRNRMQKINRKELKVLWDKSLVQDLLNPVVDNILSRRSIRKYTDQEIPSEILDMILKCGYHAPSGKNLQTWRFTVLTKQDDIEILKKATLEAATKNNISVYGWNNPRVIVIVSNDTRNNDGCQDASCAVENMMLAATSYGIGATWLNPLMTLRDAEPVKTILDGYGIPKTHNIWSCVAIGYPAESGKIITRKDSVVRYI